MAPVAYGALALKPWEFGRLTPGELEQLIDGYLWQSEQSRLTIARFVAPIINTCTSFELKRPVTVEMLMGTEKPKQKANKTKEQIAAELAALIAKMG